jgi:hypothetical protein
MEDTMDKQNNVMRADNPVYEHPTDVNELAIWWLSEPDCYAIAVDEHAPEDEGLPQYLQDEFNNRYGRAGRGRLWVPKGFVANDLIWPEPETPIAIMCEKCGGIVFWRKDLHTLATFPGLVTDMHLNRI